MSGTNHGINPDTGESMFNSNSPRFTTWVAFLVFTTITLGASVEVKNDQDNPTSDAKWAVACSAITFTITVVVTAMHMNALTAAMVVGTKVEGILIIILLAFWAVTVSIVSDANNNLAVGTVYNSGQGQSNTVLNGNLYYFSWAGFVTAIMLTVQYLRAVFGVDVAGQLRGRAARLSLWSGMLAASLVVMGAAVNVFEINCLPRDDSVDPAYCRRTKFAISLGCISVFVSLVVVGIKFMTNTAPFVVEGALSLFLSIMNAFGVAYITSARGPGSAIGNLYYFSWIAFLCAAMLVASCYNDYASLGQTPMGEREDEKANGHHNGGADFPVEHLSIEQTDQI